MPVLRHVELKLEQVRDGYLTGRTTLLGQTFDLEAFRVEPESWNVPDGGRGKRLQETLEGLLIDDVPLNTIQFPEFPGEWLLFMYPGENIHFKGELPPE
jgi:hypothetical protein